MADNVERMPYLALTGPSDFSSPILPPGMTLEEHVARLPIVDVEPPENWAGHVPKKGKNGY